ncbi:MAG: 50S ribosomal protein L10 [Bacteroidota bacterium]
MTRAEKTAAIDQLKEKFGNSAFFYLTDSSTLTVEQVSKLRRMCFEKGVEMKVVKNTLARKALESAPEEKNYAGLYDSLKGPTAILFTETANLPARIIDEFRADDDDMPQLKAAYIDTDVYVGNDQVKTLKDLKSKEDLIGDVILLLQSPAKNVLGALQSGGNTLTGLLKALGEREEA